MIVLYCEHCQTTHPLTTDTCPTCGASLAHAPLYEPQPAPPTIVKESPTPRVPTILIAAAIAAVVTFTTDQAAPEAICTGLATFLIWYLLIAGARRLLRK